MSLYNYPQEDGIDGQQLLVAATMKISLLDPHAPAQDHARIVRESQELLGKALKESRHLTTDLYPPVLQEGGFLPGLYWLAGWMGETHNLIVEVNGDAIPDIPKPLSIMLIQCVRELLFNIVKHAGVKVASVTVNQPEEKTIRVIVSDGGNGFPANMTTDPLPSKGLGMFQLRERLACIGGSLDVASMPEQGARVTITVPIS